MTTGFTIRPAAPAEAVAALRRVIFPYKVMTGVVAAYTSNDDRNAPMPAVNDWLGYRRVATELGAARTL